LDVVSSKIASEHQAGRVTADVIEADHFGLQRMQEEGLPQPCHARSAVGFDESVRVPADEAGTDWYINDRVLLISAGYNPDEVGGLEITELEDLLDPSLQGRMAVAQGTVTARW